MMKKLAAFLLVLSLLTGGAATALGGPPVLADCPVEHEPEFGGVYICCRQDDFDAMGFACGDSVDLVFSNGFVLEDLPYYNGYYTAMGEPLLISYPSYDYIKAAVNSGDDLWITAGLREAGRYADTQNACDIHYTDERSDYGSDAIFANFRCVEAGQLAENTLYRAASPCDNKHNRAPYTDRLMEKAQVAVILDLADDDEKIRGYIDAEDFDSPYFLSLYENGRVIPLAMDMNIASESFRSKLVSGLSALARTDGPFLVHCTEGKDRTGFVCMLLEALAGADYDELRSDYMLTYENYYGITRESEPARYAYYVGKLDEMIDSMAGDESAVYTDRSLSIRAVRFLLDAGMAPSDVLALRQRLTH